MEYVGACGIAQPRSRRPFRSPDHDLPCESRSAAERVAQTDERTLLQRLSDLSGLA